MSDFTRDVHDRRETPPVTSYAPSRSGSDDFSTRVKRKRTRETELYALPVEFVFGQPFDTLLAEATRTRCCTEEDLLALGRRLLRDLTRLARGEISHISIPRRLPRHGEHGRL